MAYAGTCVVGGRGEGVVVAIGASTEVGRIAKGLGVVEQRRSPLQAELIDSSASCSSSRSA